MPGSGRGDHRRQSSCPRQGLGFGGTGVEGVAENGGFDAAGWGDYADAVAGKIGAVLFAGCVAGVEGEGKDE